MTVLIFCATDLQHSNRLWCNQWRIEHWRKTKTRTGKNVQCVQYQLWALLKSRRHRRDIPMVNHWWNRMRWRGTQPRDRKTTHSCTSALLQWVRCCLEENRRHDTPLRNLSGKDSPLRKRRRLEADHEQQMPSSTSPDRISCHALATMRDDYVHSITPLKQLPQTSLERRSGRIRNDSAKDADYVDDNEDATSKTTSNVQIRRYSGSFTRSSTKRGVKTPGVCDQKDKQPCGEEYTCFKKKWYWTTRRKTLTAHKATRKI